MFQSEDVKNTIRDIRHENLKEQLPLYVKIIEDAIHKSYQLPDNFQLGSLAVLTALLEHAKLLNLTLYAKEKPKED